ncbi:alpha/beta fold hydrolase [Marinibactrum halimedae]|nr:alpha/beta hydrolase [Marinibactrum halimedae]MCD9457669.1 alpha/beta hydrolase [Marinibactrum halimedae]
MTFFVTMTLGCSSFSPALEDRVKVLGWQRTVSVYGDLPMITVAPNLKPVVLKEDSLEASSTRLHVYIEGDGIPWINGRFVSADPTPMQPLAFELMVKDPRPTLYLGRPCYFGLSDEPVCEPALWTNERYSPQVVESMAQALDAYIAPFLLDDPSAKITLFGYSGGGTLALLLAPKNEAVDRVVTIAGNLDPEQWTETFGYLPLQGSLNPTHLPFPGRGKPSFQQVHIVGDNDDVVPLAISDAYLEVHGGERWVKNGFSHSCCWLEAWPELLQQLEQFFRNG